MNQRAATGGVEAELLAVENKLYPIDFAFGRVSYATSAESQKMWQDLVDRNMAKLMSLSLRKP